MDYDIVRIYEKKCYEYYVKYMCKNVKYILHNVKYIGSTGTPVQLNQFILRKLMMNLGSM